MRGGGVIHGPVVRSHATSLPKKIRRMGLKHALSDKMSEKKLFVVNSFSLERPKTSVLSRSIASFGVGKFFLIAGNVVDFGFACAVRNLPGVSLVPQIGANVYDVMRSDYVIIDQSALSLLEERLR
jgi:large subunit ribosomal protein L4